MLSLPTVSFLLYIRFRPSVSKGNLICRTLITRTEVGSPSGSRWVPVGRATITLSAAATSSTFGLVFGCRGVNTVQQSS